MTFLIEDQKDCGAFYSCDNGTLTRITCSDKQLFNIDSGECENPKNVACGKRPTVEIQNQCNSQHMMKKLLNIFY
jgi:hypothetical protein